MATVAVLMANIVRLGKAVEKYAAIPKPTPKQQAALTKNVGLLNVNIAALQAALVTAPLVPSAAPALAPVEKPPNFGVRQEMSAALYGAWVDAWFVRTFPLGTADPGDIAKAALADGCLAQVSACGSLGYPDGIYAKLGDWSLYTALVSIGLEGQQFEHRVYHMGALVGTQVGGPGDGLAYAKTLGFNW